MIHSTNIQLCGTNYDIGKKIGEITAQIPPLKELMTSGFEGFDKGEVALAKEMFDRWCPGLNDEIEGYADALGVELTKVNFYGMTSLIPRCSQVTVMPEKSANGHVMMARNYEFSHECEDFSLVRTCVDGKYAHLGTSVMQLGREEGINECGLGVTMSSCGFPVGAVKEMRAPKIRGLQFWAVIRSILENCKDVTEALAFIKDMPIAYNLNMIVADKMGHAALVETVDGMKAIKGIDITTDEKYLCAANHVLLPKLKEYEPMVMKHSMGRYDIIKEFISSHDKVSSENLKELLLTKYPNGLCSHYYSEFFGTTKSIVMDLNEGSLDICWAGLKENGFKKYYVADELEEGIAPLKLNMEKSEAGFFDMVGR